MPNTQSTLAGLHILLVDDEPDILILLSLLLKRSGATVTAVASVGAALQAFNEHLPHIVVSDLGMPQQNGYDLIRTIRALDPKAGGQTPAIALTNFIRPEDRERALSAGFQQHVSKAVDRDELIRIIFRWTH